MAIQISDLDPTAAVVYNQVIALDDPNILDGNNKPTTYKATFAQVLAYITANTNTYTVTTSTQQMIPNARYITNCPTSKVIYTLPTSMIAGDKIIVNGLSADLFRISQNAGQQIIIGSSSTTVGTSGHIDSTNQSDAIILSCLVSNTIFGVDAAPIGIFNLT